MKSGNVSGLYWLPYDTSVKDGTYAKRALPTAFLYTMGMPEGTMAERLKPMEDFISTLLRTSIQTLSSCLAYSFLDDWTNYEASDLSAMAKRREETFPADCEKALQLGASLVQG